MAINGKRLRAAWLQVHKWIGLTLAILIIPISLTGSALVWHDWLDARLEPQRHASLGPAALAPSAYAAAATAALRPGETLSALRFNTADRPVVATAVKAAEGAGRPLRTTLWLDPRDAALIDRASGNRGAVQVIHVLHGSLMVPGWGRTIVGWVGVFMLVSCLSGIWLWWPLSGGPASGLRWKRRNTLNANLHYMSGFWILFPLAMLSFTGAWISFPKLFGQFESRPAAAGANREAAARALPLARPASDLDQIVEAASPFATGALTAISWPTDQKTEWKVAFERAGGAADVLVAEGRGTVTPPLPPSAETLARTMRRWHDGSGMGAAWQILIFLGGIIPALLSVTGIIIWWRARKPRARAVAYRRATV